MRYSKKVSTKCTTQFRFLAWLLIVCLIISWWFQVIVQVPDLQNFKDELHASVWPSKPPSSHGDVPLSLKLEAEKSIELDNAKAEHLPGSQALTRDQQSPSLLKEPVPKVYKPISRHAATSDNTVDGFSAAHLWNQSLSMAKHQPVFRGHRTASNHTLVTVYFRAKSKHSTAAYNDWMVNIMSLRDPLVIFTEPELIDTLSQLRGEDVSTVLIPCTLQDLPAAVFRSDFHHPDSNLSYWEHQLAIDPERKAHQSYQVFWIWLSKSWAVAQAIQQNFFQSTFFVYTDIGCFRKAKYNNKQVVSNEFWSSPVRPDEKTILWMAHHRPNPPPTYVWTNKLREKDHFYHSGSQGAGFAGAWLEYNRAFAQTLDDYSKAGPDVFVGEDQCILQATCLRENDRCAYVPADQVHDNFYFGLRYLLHEPYKPKGRDEFSLWRPPRPSAEFLGQERSA